MTVAFLDDCLQHNLMVWLGSQRRKRTGASRCPYESLRTGRGTVATEFSLLE